MCALRSAREVRAASNSSRQRVHSSIDPLFYVPEYECTFGELAPEVKNRISHRARALGRLRDVLKDKI